MKGTVGVSEREADEKRGERTRGWRLARPAQHTEHRGRARRGAFSPLPPLSLGKGKGERARPPHAHAHLHI
eukprot:scaffold8020_cov163-Isochrysis_galbana.AAC.1